MIRVPLAITACLITGIAHANPQDAGNKSGATTQDITVSKHHSAQSDIKHKTLQELLPGQEQPKLWIGSAAPALQLSHFPRGEPIASLEPGQIYVIEMWATWCGPCIAAFPHVASLQEKYGDKIRVIGVNVWEGSEGDARVEQINEFVAEHTEMRYTVAIEEGTAMVDTWMKPSGRSGIPAAFIVDGAGTVVWLGHPMAMDEPLEQVIKGEYDIEAATEKMWLGHLTSIAYDQMYIAESKADTDRLHEVAGTLVFDAFYDAPQPINAISWLLLNYEKATPEIYQLAYNAAQRACELTDWEDWMILDTYALAAHKTGDNDTAVKWQKKAIERSHASDKKLLESQLKLFEADS